ncbi:MAG TPA: Na+/H+ antiporter, partial [Solirubrobacterales bacterium]|nr:Na+/H+ antiporter [Solirubrobacterales bacterium]
VAAVAHYALGFDWAPAFVIGAIVSPTDPVAATAIGRQLGVPHRIITIVEGESLINDGTALVAYKFAVAAVVTGSFSLLEASGEFVLSGMGGIAVGIVIGAIVAAVRRRLDNPPVEITIALVTAYFAYLPAEAIGVSGVLAAVTVGIYMGRLTSQLTTPTTRIQGIAVWEILVFLLNSALFVLIGLQLPLIVEGLDDGALGELIAQGALIAGVVMVIRLLWVFPFTYGPRHFFRPDEAHPPWQNTLIVAWAGMRGAVTLAAALAVPLTIDGGGAFPERDEIIFLAFCVIMGSLVVQGLSLPLLIRFLGLDDEDSDLAHEENKARLKAVEGALARIEELETEEWVREDTADRVRRLYVYRQRRFSARFADDGSESDGIEARSEDYQRLVREILDAQRAVLIGLRDEGRINDAVMRTIERELDLEDSRLEI